MEYSKRQLEIITTSIDLITENGIQGLSTRHISERIGVSEPAIYRHFKNKRDIIINIALYMFDNWQELFKRMDIPEAPAIVQLEYVATGIIKYFIDNVSSAVALNSLKSFQQDKALLKKLLSVFEIAIKSAGEIIQKGQNEGNIRKDIENKDISKVIIGSIYLLYDKWNLSDYKTNLMAEWKSLWKEMKKLLEVV